MRLVTGIVLGLGLGFVACADSEKPGFPLDAGVQILDPNTGKDAGIADTPTTPDPNRPDASDPNPDMPPCDGLEPNDHPDRATSVTVDRAEIDSALCAGDEDWFAVSLNPGDGLDVVLDLDHGQGDLDMIVYGPDLEEVTRSETTTDRESAGLTAGPSGLYYVQIYGYESANGDYTLTIERQPGDPPCQDDTLEDNDTLTGARQLLPPESFNATLCSFDDDVYAIDLEVGEVFRASLEFEHALGDLDMKLIAPGGGTAAEGASSDDDETVRHEVTEDGVYILQIVGYGGAEAPYRLDVSVGFDAPPGPHLATGQILFDDPFLDRGVYDYARRPLAGAVVEVVVEDNGEVLGVGSTDGSGRYRIRFDGSGRSGIYTRVLARRRGPEATIDVVTNARRVYAVRSFETLAPSGDMVFDMLLTQSEGLIDAFNILDALNRGFVWWSASFEVRGTPPLHVVWEEGQQFACGTCFRASDAPATIYLYGQETDNDALDDPVILHELGHFIQNTFSKDDSPGGSHDGTPIDPRLAWAEGWATAFASMVRDEPIYYDTRGTSLVFHDLESPVEDVAVFTGSSVSSPISEYFVASVLWDIYDAANEDNDQVSAGIASIHPVIDYLDIGQRGQRGIDGIDLFDYLDGAHCLDVAPAGALDALIDASGFPYSGPPGGCKPSNPVSAVFLDPKTLQITPRRSFDRLEVLSCGAAQVCTSVFKGDGGPATVEVGKVGGQWLEIRMGSGDWRWTEIVSLSPEPVVKPLWQAAPPTLDGVGVVSQMASR